MVIKQQQVPIFGKAEIWQVLLEYEHAGKQPAVLTGFRVEWQAGVMAERLVGQSIPVEVVQFSGTERKVIDHVIETIGRRCRCERAFKSGVALQHGESVQVRARFPFPLNQAQVVLF